MKKLRRIHGQSQSTGATSLSRFSDNEILEQLSWRLVSGSIQIFRTGSIGAPPMVGSGRKTSPDESTDDDDWVPHKSEDERVTSTTYSIFVRLPVDPDDSANVKDKFTLIGGSSVEQPQYEQTRTTANDTVAGENCVDLAFADLLPDLYYWLKVDPGENAEEYFAFERIAWARLKPIARPK